TWPRPRRGGVRAFTTNRPCSTYRDLVSGEVRESAAPQVRLTGKGLGVVRSRLTDQPAFELLGIRVVTA
ncbi:hypothetical protein, partial [Micrococcus sp. F3Y]|uniref:hypothetical protein n=1 Tax=Micrococcus sp. F3Y TaxID=3402627 RepID=UPI003AF63D90